jgi:16S rRNA processing protein RimM
MTNRFVVGLVGAPFGLKGFVKVRPLSGEIDHLLRLTRVILRRDGTEKTLDIEASAPALPQVVIKFTGIDSPEAARALGGAELVTGREEASPLNPGEYYVEDLRGLVVIAAPAGADTVDSQNTEILGHISDIVEGGGGDLVEIRLLNGEFKFVPFRNEFFAPLDLDSGWLMLWERWILD